MVAFEDGFPVSEGHLLIVPKKACPGLVPNDGKGTDGRPMI